MVKMPNIHLQPLNRLVAMSVHHLVSAKDSQRQYGDIEYWIDSFYNPKHNLTGMK